MTVAGVMGYEQERQTGLFGGGAQTPCRGDVAADRAIGSLFADGRGHGVVVGKLVGIGGVVVSGLDGDFVGFGHGRILLGEFRIQIVEGILLGTVEHPEADAQRKHVLALGDGLVVQTGLLEGFAGHGRDVGYDDVVLVEIELCQRVKGFETGLLEVLFGDRVAVDDDRGTGLEPFAVGLQGGGIHGHQHVAIVTGVEFAVVSEVDLEAGDAGHRTLRGADFGRIVGKGRGSVTEQRRGIGKERTRELHAVARISGESNDHVLQLPHFGLFHDFWFQISVMGEQVLTNI